MIREFLTRVNPKQKKIFTELQTAIMALPETVESIEIDELEGEWCPAYRVRGSDLVWVHFDEHLWVNFPVEPSFEKKVLQDENLDRRVIESVQEAEESGDTKWAKIQLRSDKEIEDIVAVLELRNSFLRA
ncbi:MAG TPA: hypothetical protein VEH56_06695 [Candidatus Saccharimonadales bacterium]|nr:hypothetical protein [Candidatus Saccharimonadales bacterium]